MSLSLGSEIEVVPDLLLSGAFAHINATMVEWHERLAKGEERKKISRKLQVASLKTWRKFKVSKIIVTGWT